MISSVYNVEGLGHNLLSVGQFCDSDLEVAFTKHSCFVRELDGIDLLKGRRGTNLYTISIEDRCGPLLFACNLRPLRTKHGYGIVVCIT